MKKENHETSNNLNKVDKVSGGKRGKTPDESFKEVQTWFGAEEASFQ
jgi:hypothetical protein